MTAHEDDIPSDTSNVSDAFSDDEPHQPAAGDLVPIIYAGSEVQAVKVLTQPGTQHDSYGPYDVIKYFINGERFITRVRDIKCRVVYSAIQFMARYEAATVYYKDQTGENDYKKLASHRKRLRHIDDISLDDYPQKFDIYLVGGRAPYASATSPLKTVLVRSQSYKVMTPNCKIHYLIARYDADASYSPEVFHNAGGSASNQPLVTYRPVLGKYPHEDNTNPEKGQSFLTTPAEQCALEILEPSKNLAIIDEYVCTFTNVPEIKDNCNNDLAWLVRSFHPGDIFSLDFEELSQESELELKNFLIRDADNQAVVRKLFNLGKWVVYIPWAEEKIGWSLMKHSQELAILTKMYDGRPILRKINGFDGVVVNFKFEKHPRIIFTLHVMRNNGVPVIFQKLFSQVADMNETCIQLTQLGTQFVNDEAYLPFPTTTVCQRLNLDGLQRSCLFTHDPEQHFDLMTTLCNYADEFNPLTDSSELLLVCTLAKLLREVREDTSWRFHNDLDHSLMYENFVSQDLSYSGFAAKIIGGGQDEDKDEDRDAEEENNARDPVRLLLDIITGSEPTKMIIEPTYFEETAMYTGSLRNSYHNIYAYLYRMIVAYVLGPKDLFNSFRIGAANTLSRFMHRRFDLEDIKELHECLPGSSLDEMTEVTHSHNIDATCKLPMSVDFLSDHTRGVFVAIQHCLTGLAGRSTKFGHSTLMTHVEKSHPLYSEMLRLTSFVYIARSEHTLADAIINQYEQEMLPSHPIIDQAKALIARHKEDETDRLKSFCKKIFV